MPLQAPDVMQEEEVGRILLQWRVVGIALYFRVENRRDTELRQYSSTVYDQ